MLLHDLLDDVELRDHLLEVRGDTGIDVGSIVHDSRRRDARRAVLLHSRRAQRRSRLRARGASRRARSRCLVERVLAVDVPQVRVDSVRRVLGPLCARFHGDPSRAMRVLGVTGTNGKTSTTYLLEAIARARRRPGGRDRHGRGAHRRRGRPAAAHDARGDRSAGAARADARPRRSTTVAMEVSSHALDQHRVDGTRFAAVAFTNLTHEHLDYHATVDAYFEAKARLFDAAVLAARGDQHRRRVRRRARATARVARGPRGVHVLDRRPDADVYARDVLLRRDETLFELVDARDDHHGVVRSPLVGRFNVANALAAAATALVAGVLVRGGARRARRAGAGAGPLRARRRRPRLRRARRLRAHARRAGRRCSSAARSLVDGGKLRRGVRVRRRSRPREAAADGRGRDPPRRRRDPHVRQSALGGSRTRSRATCSPGCRPTAPRPSVELDRRAAIRAALRGAAAGDVVVIAGKGHETGQTAGGVTMPFDDRVVAAEELEACS